jgi:hypothetical protein
MRFRQASSAGGRAALRAAPPACRAASLYHIRPQNRQAVVLAVRFCSIYRALLPLRCHWPSFSVAVLAMARIARRNGSLSAGQARMTFCKSAQAGEIGALIGASEFVLPGELAVCCRFKSCTAHHHPLFELPMAGHPSPLYHMGLAAYEVEFTTFDGRTLTVATPRVEVSGCPITRS